MSDILSQVFTLPVQIALILTVIILILLYLLAIVWVFKDASQRDTPTLLWTIIAIVPVAGLVAYCLLRPPLTRVDQDEQDMELDLLQRQLEEFGECPMCGQAVKDDYLVCPHCARQLRNVCSRCGKALDPSWSTCPYCATPVRRGGASDKRAAKAASGDPFEPKDAK